MVLWDQATEETCGGFGTDAVRIIGGNCWIFLVREVKGHLQPTAGVATSGPQGGVGVIEVVKRFVSAAR